VCLGDLVGYHAFPAETLALIQAGATDCVAGNHDLIAVGRLGTQGCEPKARRGLLWTRRKLTGTESAFLAALPAERRVQPDLLFVHAALDDPGFELQQPWQYYEESRAIHHRFPEVRVCFTGHVPHQQVVEISPNGEAFVRTARQFVLPPDSFCFVNPGSVGCPADGDYRAAYAVYDLATRRVTFRRTTYDRLRVMQENIRHGLDGELGISRVGYLKARAAAAARSIRTRIFAGIS
jgi:diadenosine tetraphosphatase ApaH/serine/threonine PP2A family protein phosphatase